jgi:DNA-binding MarR family transcriptional regulator
MSADDTVEGVSAWSPRRLTERSVRSGRHSKLMDKLELLAQTIDDLHCATAAWVGLNRSEFEALAHIVRSDGLTDEELAAGVGVTEWRAAVLAGRLERSGHVVRGEGGRDGRPVALFATEKGRHLVDGASTLGVYGVGEIASRRSPEDLSLLTEFLEQARRSFIERATALRSGQRR